MLSVLLLASLHAHAGDLQMVHSARLVGADGGPVGGTHDVTVTLYTASSAPVWQQRFEDEPFPNGHFSVTLATDPAGRTLESALIAAEPAVWVGIQLDDDDELQPWSPLTSVPLAARTLGVPVASGLLGTSCPGDGAMSLDTDLGNLTVCVDGQWTAVAAPCAATEIRDGSCRLPRSCKELHEHDETLDSGIYSIDPDGMGGFAAECDMTTADGGWTRVVKSAPASTNPVWNDVGGYGTPESSSHISAAWHRLTDFTQMMDSQGATPTGGDISACWTNESLAAQTVKPSFTCSPAPVAGLTQRSTYQFNVSASHQGCSGLTANLAYYWQTWDNGVSGAWTGLASSGYKTNNTSRCSTSCVKYSNSCLADTYTGNSGTLGSMWVR